MLTRVLALELGPKGIRVNTLNPGATDVTKSGANDVPGSTPLRRFGQPLDIAKGVVFLASSDANFITGANLVVDGGLVYNIGALFVKANQNDFPIHDYKDVMHSRNMTGKVVVVTGSCQGIGQSVVKLFSILGAHVVITGRNETVVKEVAKEVQQLSPYKLKPLNVTMDFTKSADLKELIAKTAKHFGKIDVLVNAVDISPDADIWRPNLLTVWDQVFNVNLRAVVELIHHAVPHLAKTKGTVINISTIGAIAPLGPYLAYGSAEAALDMLGRVLALELGPKGVRVNTINPGLIVTECEDCVEPTAGEMDYLEKITPLRRLGEPLDVAKGVAFLASTDAQFITGTNLVIDGGLVYNYAAILQPH
ncbi:unnamed protein product [Medioppia subpectinata]|uniref:Uncharacterized protein n=1 Tax=Medioppia subpectinata TaxID=1979941 RepID=A0A7R9L6C3_9ACAR|nr:unnamed protein product [Medioppia subpectinata]CAG2116213.1 unnamed protein product [Medioppia subpectinata]